MDPDQSHCNPPATTKRAYNVELKLDDADAADSSELPAAVPAPIR
jgi:hypothetical protein